MLIQHPSLTPNACSSYILMVDNTYHLIFIARLLKAGVKISHLKAFLIPPVCQQAKISSSTYSLLLDKDSF